MLKVPLNIKKPNQPFLRSWQVRLGLPVVRLGLPEVFYLWQLLMLDF